MYRHGLEWMTTNLVRQVVKLAFWNTNLAPLVNCLPKIRNQSKSEQKQNSQLVLLYHRQPHPLTTLQLGLGEVGH